MKDFALNHPWMTFFLVDAAITGVVRLVYALTGYHENEKIIRTEEQSEDEDKCEEVSE